MFVVIPLSKVFCNQSNFRQQCAMRVSYRAVPGRLFYEAGLLRFSRLHSKSTPARISFAAHAESNLEKIVNTKIDGKTPVLAFVAEPDSRTPRSKAQKIPAVIMVHEFYGLNESIRDKALELSKAGYFVVAPDVYRGTSTKFIPKAIFLALTTSTEQTNLDLDTVFKWTCSQPNVDNNDVSIVGFCFGGGKAMQYSLHNPRVASTVVFYGKPELDADKLRSITGPVLGIYGSRDNQFSVNMIEQFDKSLDKANVRHRVRIFEGQPHAFVRNTADIQQEGPQKEAWDEMLSFLRTKLR